jgi:hypothetical protein
LPNLPPASSIGAAMNSGNVDPQEFGRRLSDFLAIVRQSVPNVQAAPWHLGFPAGGPTLVGSDVGREIWATPEGQRLVDYLLTDPALREWFAPPPDSVLVELRFFVASVVEKWASSGAPADDFAATRASEILDAIRSPQVVCRGASLVYGVALDQGLIQLPYGLSITPATADTWATVLPRLGVSITDLIRAPNRPALLLTSSVAASRTEMPGFAASWADGDCRIWLERLRTAIWLASGVLPARGDMYLFQESPYPALPFDRISPPPEQRFPQDLSLGGEARLDGAFLSDVLVRMGAVWGTTEAHVGGEAVEALWVADGTYLPQALEFPDSSSTVLMAYAAIDGLLRDKTDDDSRLAPRVGCLIGGSNDDRRAVRRFVDRLRNIRGEVAHGKRPHLADVAGAIGRDVADAALAERGIFADQELNRLLRRRCLDVLRRVLVSFLWLTVEGEPWPGDTHRPRAWLGLTREQVLKTLDRAHNGDSEALTALEGKIPRVLRGGLLP